MTAPTSRNRLDEEESPYLRQHADNPVNWQPWDDAALAAARERDVPIFLSIGYAACHWCHVMEEESFRDERVAELLNEQFVPIKVDREERPDVDSIYMSICQRVTGRGGWPLSAWLTPEGEPFYVGTYFPPEPKRGQPGFRQLLGNVASAWNDPDEREDIEDRAAQWTRAVADDLESVPEGPGESPEDDQLERAAEAAVRGADREESGWGTGQKFPHPGRLHLLMRAHDRTGREPFREVACETLDAMAEGGMYDHLGGGFHRYTVDRTWTVPHFEKMLYDNAELTRAYLAGYRLTGDDRYATVAGETLTFVERELTHPEGGFYSTLDAQSETADGESEEGAFYVWTPGAVEGAVEAHATSEIDRDLAAAVFCDHYGVTPGGNFEGRTVLTRATSVDAVADAHDLDFAACRNLLAAAEEAVREARAERPRPARDEKVLAGWNGLMISAFAEAAIALDDGYAGTAVEALTFVRERLWDEDAGRLRRRFKDGDVAVDGYLEDYAFLGRAALDCFEATGDVDHLAFALALAGDIESEFWDGDAETLYFTPASGEDLITRPQELDDSSTPSSTGVAASFLAAVDRFSPRDAFGEIAAAVVRTHGAEIEANPLRHASLTIAADTVTRGATELTVAVDDPRGDVARDWLAAIGEPYLPARLVAWRPPDDAGLREWLDDLSLGDAPPIWANRAVRDGRPTVYACRSFTCSPPQHDVEAALDWLEGELPTD
jgi:uncharacterized protein YyaL (SSP411 family)